jgi:hypothetical protein
MEIAKSPRALSGMAVFAGALALGLAEDSVAAADGAVGASSSSSMQIRVSVAQRGSLDGLAPLEGERRRFEQRTSLSLAEHRNGWLCAYRIR